MSIENRLAIEEFETLAKGIILRGYYKPGGDSGASLRQLMAMSRPALYEYVADDDRVDAAALSYVLMRLPVGIWNVRQITVTGEIASEVAEDFVPVETRARRRPTYRTGEHSLVTAFSGGMSDLIDFISALTCYQIESDKIRIKYAHHLEKSQEDGESYSVWDAIEKIEDYASLSPEERKSLLHELSVELKADYGAMKNLDRTLEGGLLDFVRAVIMSHTKDLKIIFPDRFSIVGAYSKRAKAWCTMVLESMAALDLADKRIHLVSSNRHSLVNCLSPHVRSAFTGEGDGFQRYAEMRKSGRDGIDLERIARDRQGGIHYLETPVGMPFCQLIDMKRVDGARADDRIGWNTGAIDAVILNMDYAFGEEGFYLFNELCETFGPRLRGVYIMGKAGTLVGERGDIMLPSFFVKQGTGDVYDLGNCLNRDDFIGILDRHEVFDRGPMLTVAGTFLQNEDVLRYFRDNWSAMGVEMEGIPYARALAQATLRKRASNLKVGIVYYASDAPLRGDLLSIPLGDTGVTPVYAATIAILRNILASFQ